MSADTLFNLASEIFRSWSRWMTNDQRYGIVIYRVLSWLSKEHDENQEGADMKQPTRGSYEGRLRTPIAVHAMLIAVMLLLSACKGSSSEPTPQPNAQPTSAVVKLSTVGTLPAGKKIGTIDVSLNLAPGVTLKTGTNPIEPDTAVVTASGAAAGSLLAANYTAPTSTQPGRLRIAVISMSGFASGEFATVNGDIAAGNNPKASDFRLINFTATDNETPSSPLTGLTAGLSVDIL
jgi:hypothetical protein